MPKGRPTIERIKQAVERQERATAALRQRMDEDYEKWYCLQQYNAGEGVESYTTLEPRVYAQKIMMTLANAKVRVQCPYGQGHAEKRDQGDIKEKVANGLLNAGNARLRRRGLSTVHGANCTLLPLRGFYAGRWLIYQDKGRETQVDITPWDARNVYWEEGGDGLYWACLMTECYGWQIEAEYGIELKGAADPERLYKKYDWFDEQYNCVVVEDEWLKRPVPHHAPRTPVIIGRADEMPAIVSRGTIDRSARYGESIYASTRELYDKINHIMSIYLELCKRARDSNFTLTSLDGKRVLKEHPYATPSAISLKEGERLELIKLAETTKDAQVVLTFLDGEIQRGGLPHSIYGDIQVALSGFAINTLRQGVNTVIEPFLRALSACYEQGLELLVDQYKSGYYEPMQLSGNVESGRVWFDERFTPDLLIGAGNLVVSVLPDLPQDDPGKMQMAVQAMGAGLLDLRTVLDEILQVQDADLIIDSIKANLGEQNSPLAAKVAQMLSAATRGETNTANILLSEIQMLIQQMAMMGAMPPNLNEQEGPLVPNQGAARGNRQPALPSPGGMPSNVLPPEQAGIQKRPSLQAGPYVPPGTPRPGAQSDTTRRLNAIGLSGPNQG